MHEDFLRDEELKPPSERSFGLVIAGFFILVAFSPLLHARPVRWWALIPAALFAVLAVLWTEPLAPLNRLWLRFGLLLYKIVNPLVLGLLFYTTVTPVGWIMRRFRKDPLRLRRAPHLESYWLIRQPAGPSPESMRNQF
jgi:hypothetical protein